MNDQNQQPNQGYPQNGGYQQPMQGAQPYPEGYGQNPGYQQPAQGAQPYPEGYGQNPGYQQPAQGVQPQYPQGGYQQAVPPVPPKAPGKARIVIPIVIAAVVVLAIGGGVFAWFMMNQYSLTGALLKTFSGERMLADYISDTEDGNFTIKGELEISTADVSVDAEYDYAMNLAAKETSFNVAGSAMGVSQRADFYMNDSALFARFPDLIDRVFKYDYTTDKTNSGLTALLGEENGPKEWDKTLSQYWRYVADSKAWREESTKNVLAFLQGLEETKLENAEVVIDEKGNKAACPGYAYKIGKENVRKLAEDLISGCDKYVALDGEAKKAMDAFWDEVRKNVDSWQTVTMTGYVYQGRFASLSFSTDEQGEYLKLSLLGTNYPTEDMEIRIGGQSGATIEVYGDAGEKSQTRSISMIREGEEVELLHLEYIPDRHKLDVELDDGLFQSLAGQKLEMEFSVTSAKGASVQKISGGQIFDLAEADMMEYMALGGELQEKLGSILPFGF